VKKASQHKKKVTAHLHQHALQPALDQSSLHYLFVCNILSANKSIHHHGVKFLSTRDLIKQRTFLELSQSHNF